MELIKQIEINIDYIMMLVNKYHDTHCEDKEILITIRKAVDSSPELRSKKALIENFINGVNEIDDVMNEWHDYVVEMREHDLQIIIEEERLKPVETRKFLENKVFVPLIANNDNGENTSSESETFYCTRGGINSIGVRTSDGFVVKKGSVISSKVTKSCPEYVLKKRDQYKKILDDKNTLIDDILFNTPSGAASFVCGSSANGNVEWKNSAGVTIKELDEQQEE